LHDLFVALALVLVIEGLLYAAFPRQMRSLVDRMTQFTDMALRQTGLFTAALGVVLIWIIKEFF
tara:strand:- start:1568 stop:1759 length:192 start_codon:yes stop_codon:yes gene_type:complete